MHTPLPSDTRSHFGEPIISSLGQTDVNIRYGCWDLVIFYQWGYRNKERR